MKRTLNNFFAMNAYYTDTLSNHGVKMRPANKITSGYGSFKDFKDNIKAPIQIPVVILSSNLRAVIGCIENTIYLVINLATMDFSDARNNCISILNNISSILYQSLRAVLDITLSLVELLVCPLFTLKESLGSHIELPLI